MRGRGLGLLALAWIAPAWAAAESLQPLEDAWWTGPLLASSAATLPRGHFLVEPYLFDSLVHRRFDEQGTRQPTAHQESLGSLTYVLYGVTDKITAGIIPTFGYTLRGPAGSSSGIELGDFALQGQYRLTRFEPGSWVPTTSLVLGETFPTGRYDQLGHHPADGFGAGVRTTTLSLYMQDYFWMPNGRILRSRLDLSYAFSSSATVRDVSVYGTTSGFRGRVRPGDGYTADAAWEYSATRNWVLALDVLYAHNGATQLRGIQLPTSTAGDPYSVFRSSGTSESLSFAPAVEYNWSARIGLIAGVKFAAQGRNASAPVIPVIALNIVY